MLSPFQRNLVFDAIEQISGLTLLPQVGVRFAGAMEAFGFRALGINGLPPPGEGADPDILTEETPEGFRGLYIQERFYSVDHICACARTAREPFRYSDAPFNSTEPRTHQRFMQALQTFGMGQGLIVPLGRPEGVPACVWLAGEEPNLDDESIMAVQLIALFAAGKAHALLPRAAPAGDLNSPLNQREREILQWTAAGKTSWEISVILNLSERTVNKYMADAMTKLKAVTRAQAVATAIRDGEIEL